MQMGRERRSPQKYAVFRPGSPHFRTGICPPPPPRILSKEVQALVPPGVPELLECRQRQNHRKCKEEESRAPLRWSISEKPKAEQGPCAEKVGNSCLVACDTQTVRQRGRLWEGPFLGDPRTLLIWGASASVRACTPLGSTGRWERRGNGIRRCKAPCGIELPKSVDLNKEGQGRRTDALRVHQRGGQRVGQLPCHQQGQLPEQLE